MIHRRDHRSNRHLPVLLLIIALLITACGASEEQAALPTLAALPNANSSTDIVDEPVADSETNAVTDAAAPANETSLSDESTTAGSPAAIANGRTVVDQPIPIDPEAFTPVMEVPAEIEEPITDTIMVRFDSQTTPAEREAFIESVGGVVTEDIPALDTIVLTVDETRAADIETRVANGEVAGAEPDYLVSIQADITPSDPFYVAQWNLPALGISDYWDDLADDVSAITVAVIDSGICQNHPDLAGRITAGYDFVEDDTIPQDTNGHGCAMSGVIGANINSEGITGLAPGVNIMPIRVLDASGLGTYSDVASGIIYAADNGADVINMSLAGIYQSTTLQGAVNYALARGVTVVASAGNAGTDTPYYPAAHDGVISVGSVDQNYSVSNFSNYGSTVDVYVPGRDIWSTMESSYAVLSGTSPAAAHVSGLEALSRAAGKDLVIDGPMSLLREPEEAEPTVTPIIEAQNTSPTGVILPDNRTRVTDTNTNPAISVVQLRYGNAEDGECTGFLIDREYVFTAASCVEDTNGSRITSVDPAYRVIAVPGANGDLEPYGKLYISQDPGDIRVPANWDPANPNSAFDYAVLKLETPVPANIVTFQLTQYDATTANQGNFTYVIAGYPQSGNCLAATQPENCGRNQFVTQTPTAMDATTTTTELRYDIDVAQNGQAGSPIYRSGTTEVIGIHSRFDDPNDLNRGMRITQTVINQLDSWGIPRQSGVDGNEPGIAIIEAGDSASLVTEIGNLNANGGTIFLRKQLNDVVISYDLQTAETANFVLPTITGNITIIGLETDNTDGPAILNENSSLTRQLVNVAGTGSLTLHNLTVQNFNNNGTGTLQVSNGGSLRIEDITFSQNTSNLGGAINAQAGSTVSVYNSTFTGNVGNTSGGAIYNAGDLIVVNRSDPDNPNEIPAFGSNNADNGGAIFNTGAGTASIQETLFNGNVAGSSTEAGSGGALFSDSSSTVNINTSFFIMNTSSSRGGAISQLGSGTMTIADARLNNNIAGPASPQDQSPAGEGAAMFTQGPVVMTGLNEAIDNITYRRTENDALDPTFKGGAFDINGTFSLVGPGTEDPSIIQGNKILFDDERDGDPSDADQVSTGAAFYIRAGNTQAVTINNTCISANLSNSIQGIDNQSGVNVDATNNYWGDAGGPSGAGSGNGDGISTNVNAGSPITEAPGDCNITVLPPTNDGFINATELTLLEADLAFNNTNANIGNLGTGNGEEEDDDPIATCGITNKSIWYTYTPTKSYTGSISVNAFGVENSFPIVSVWTGTREQISGFDPAVTPELIAERQPACGFGDTTNDPAIISSFDFVANTTYYLFVGTRGSVGGDSRVSIVVNDVVLSEPLNNTTLGSRTPTFTWSTDGVGYADDYELAIIRASDSTPVTSLTIPSTSPSCVGTICSLQLETPLGNDEYRWSVTAVDNTLPADQGRQQSLINNFSINSNEPFDLITNGEFIDGEDGYTFFGAANLQRAVVDEQLVMNRIDPAGAATGFQTTVNDTLTDGEKFQFSMDMENPFPESKLVVARIKKAPNDSSGQISCVFNVTASTPLRTYQIRTSIPSSWIENGVSTPTVEVRPLDYDGADGIIYDSLTMVRLAAGQDVSGTPCIAPDLATDRNLVVNPSMNFGTERIRFVGPIDQSLNDGTLSVTRTADFETLPYIQTVQFIRLQAGLPFEVSVRLGNTSSVPKSVHLFFRATNNAQVERCVFTVPPNTGLNTYSLTFATSRVWPDIATEVLLDDFNTPSILVDDISVKYRPNLDAPTDDANCISPNFANTNLLVNSDFTQPVSADYGGGPLWKIAGPAPANSELSGGTASLAAGANIATLLNQDLSYELPANAPFEMNLQLTNTGAETLTARVALYGPTAPNIFCDFEIPPNSDTDAYIMRGLIPAAWDGAPVVSVGLLTPNASFLQVDNVDLRYVPGLETAAKECEANLISNGSFIQSDTDYQFFGPETHTTDNNTLMIRRTNTSAPAGFSKGISTRFLNNSEFQLDILVGNTSDNAKNFTVELTGSNGGQPRSLLCEFVVLAETELTRYRMSSSITDGPWENVAVRMTLEGFGEANYLVDNISLQQLPAQANIPLTCTEPALGNTGFKNTVVNAQFDAALDGNWLPDNVTATVNSGQIEIARITDTAASVFTQFTRGTAPAGTTTEVTFDVQNPTSQSYQLDIVLTGGVNATSGGATCKFTVPGNSSRTYILRTPAGNGWDGPRVRFRLNGAAGQQINIDGLIGHRLGRWWAIGAANNENEDEEE
ncbi:MAG: S8 family serine peptidase [Chloroflexota bacterium]